MRRQNRRSVLASIGLIATTGAVGLSQAEESTLQQTESSIEPTDWPTKGGNLGRTRSTVEEAAPNGEHATLAWYRGVRGSRSREPIAADGSIYWTSYTTDVIGTEGVTAFDAETGEVQWRRRPDWDSNGERRLGSASGTPAVGGERLYVRSGGDSYKNRKGGFFALDTETGETLWKREYVGTRSESPIYYDGAVFLGSIALDAETGKTIWSTDSGNLLGITNGSVYERTVSGLVARNPADGTVEHSFTFEAEPSNESAFAGGTMYFEQSDEESNDIVALSLDDGSVQWRWTATPDGEEPLAHISSPGVHDGTVYAHVSSENDDQKSARGIQSTVYALDASTGEVQWSFDTSTVLRGNPTIAGDTVYVGGHALPLREYDGIVNVFRWPTIHALATDDGTEQWNYLFRRDDHWADGIVLTARTPVVANGRVYAGGFDENDTIDGTVSPFALDPSDTAPSSWSRPIASDAPVARITTDSDTQNLDSGETVTLDGSSSTGEVESYEWRLGEGGSFDRTGPTTDVTMDFCGSLEVTLQATGPDGEATTESITLSTVE